MKVKIMTGVKTEIMTGAQADNSQTSSNPNRFIIYDYVTHLEKTFWEDSTTVTLLPKGTELQLPRDGHTIYVMNDRGDTIDTICAPD